MWREVIRYPQPRPARAQEGKKGVTSSYSACGGSPEKSERGPGLWQCARPGPGDLGACRSEELRHIQAW